MGPFIPRLSRDHCQPSRHGAVTAPRVPRIKLPISISVALSPHQTPYSPPQAYQSKTAHFLETAIWTTDQNLKVLKRDNEIKGKGTALNFPGSPALPLSRWRPPGLCGATDQNCAAAQHLYLLQHYCSTAVAVLGRGIMCCISRPR